MADTAPKQQQKDQQQKEQKQQPALRFADPSAARLAPGERGVRLRIGGGGGGEGKARAVELFAHPFMLRTWSRVLAELLESCGSGSADGNEEGGGDQHLTVPLDGDDPLAWDDALSVMYGFSCGRPFAVTWDSAERLLVLADKYDMPGVAAPVAVFLRAKYADGDARLKKHLARGADAWRWLPLVRKAGLGDLAELCIADIAHGAAPFSIARLRALEPADADRLLAARAGAAETRAAAAEARAAAAEGRANAAEARAKAATLAREERLLKSFHRTYDADFDDDLNGRVYANLLRTVKAVCWQTGTQAQRVQAPRS